MLGRHMRLSGAWLACWSERMNVALAVPVAFPAVELRNAA